MAQSANLKETPFTWEGKDRKGKAQRGKLLARSEAELKQQLRARGIIATKVRKQSTLFQKKGRVTTQDIAIFSRQLATMLAAGIPLVQAFNIIGNGHDNPAMQKLLLDVKQDIEAGTNLADALARHPLHFDDLFVNLVAAGEQAGALETLLDKIATYKEKTEALKKKIRKALTYPAAVVVVAIVVTAILLVFVVPQFEDMFTGSGADLPTFTRMVIELSQLMQAQGWIILAALIMAGYIFTYFKKRSRAFRQTLDRIALKLPAIGPIIEKSAIARYARTLSTTFSAGVPLVEALESVSGATGNIVYEDAVLRMRDEVATGIRLQRSMENMDLFPNMVIQMIAVGEESGSLDEMSSKVADFYESEVDNAVDNLSALLEPAIMSILGILVGGLVVAMYLPIFQMGQVV